MVEAHCCCVPTVSENMMTVRTEIFNIRAAYILGHSWFQTKKQSCQTEEFSTALQKQIFQSKFQVFSPHITNGNCLYARLLGGGKSLKIVWVNVFPRVKKGLQSRCGHIVLLGIRVQG